MLDYPSLEALTAVIRNGSFDGAARALGVTPSAISQRIKGLEERLGVPLVIRSTPCTATASGAQLCAHFNRVALLEHDLLASEPSWNASVGERNPTLKIALNFDSLGTWFPEAAALFSTNNSIMLDLVLDDEAYTADRLWSGEVLAAVTTIGKTVHGCQTLPLGSLRYVATAIPDFYEKYFLNGVTSKTLSHAPVLKFNLKDELQNRWTIKATGNAVEAPTHWVPSTHGFLDFTLAGLGWSLIPECLAKPFLASGRLVTIKADVPIDVPLFWQHLRITTRLLNDLTAAVRYTCGNYLLEP